MIFNKPIPHSISRSAIFRDYAQLINIENAGDIGEVAKEVGISVSGNDPLLGAAGWILYGICAKLGKLKEETVCRHTVTQ